MVAFSFSFVSEADAAKRGGGYKSPKRTYTQTPDKPATNTNKVQPDNGAGTAKAGTGAATTNRGFFSGGSLAKGLMVGGIAGLLFGGMFASMGGFGDFLGLLVNLIAIYILFIAIRGVFRYLKQQRKPDPNDPYNNRRY